jgi:hypothetical protein
MITPDRAMTDHGAADPDWIHLTPDEARTIVADAARLYFESRRARVDSFVDRHFSLAGSLTLHRKALGWDLLKVPANILLAIPNVALQLSAWGAQVAGASQTAAALRSRRVLLETAVGREIEWLIMTELLELPYKQEGRVSSKDALAETILSSAQVQAAVQSIADRIGSRADDPVFRERLEEALATYTDTRAAAAEITTTLIALGAGALTLKQATPGALVLGPALASAMAQQVAIASFPLGATLGGLWYGVFPVAASPALIAGLTGGLIGVGAIAAAFSGIIADPVQRRLGLHRRRLLRLIDALEGQFFSDAAGGLVVRDHYVARLFSLFELLAGAYRIARS